MSKPSKEIMRAAGIWRRFILLFPKSKRMDIMRLIGKLYGIKEKK